MTSRLEVERSFKEICLKFGRLDIVVNSVGVIDENDIEGTIGVNLVCTLTLKINYNFIHFEAIGIMVYAFKTTKSKMIE